MLTCHLTRVHSAEERAEYMKEIEQQMKLLGQGGFATAVAEQEEEEEEVVISDKDIYPQLS